jgi:hypothetical protein
MVEEMWKLHILHNAVTVSHMTKYHATSAALSLSYSLNFDACNIINAPLVNSPPWAFENSSILSAHHTAVQATQQSSKWY